MCDPWLAPMAHSNMEHIFGSRSWEPTNLKKDRIFNIAAELQDPAKRATYLDDACGDDVSLREEVEELLRHDQEGASFLEAPPPGVDATLDQPITEKPGTLIGRYKLLSRSAKAASAWSIMAEQTEPVQRQGGPEDHQAGHGHPGGDRPVRGRAAGAGDDGPSEHRPGARRRRDRVGPALLRDGTGPRDPDHRATATRTA